MLRQDPDTLRIGQQNQTAGQLLNRSHTIELPRHSRVGRIGKIQQADRPRCSRYRSNASQRFGGKIPDTTPW